MRILGGDGLYGWGLAIATLAAVGCGEDATADYAGLEEVEVVDEDNGVGYRVRYLSPPWELAEAGGSGFNQDCVALSQVFRLRTPDAFPPATPRRDYCTSLGIGREGSGGTDEAFALNKYYMEVSIEPCSDVFSGTTYGDDLSCLADADATATCAEVAARCEAELLLSNNDSSAGFPGSDPMGVRANTNDVGGDYWEYATINISEATRYRRGAMYDTGTGRDGHFVRVFMSSFPKLDATEVSRMFDTVHALTVEGDTPTLVSGDGL